MNPGARRPQPGKDQTAPSLKLSATKRVKLAALLRGYAFKATVSEPSSIGVQLVLARRTVGSATKSMAAAGKAKVVVKLGRKAKRRIRRARRLKLTLAVTATDAAGNAKRQTAVLRIARR